MYSTATGSQRIVQKGYHFKDLTMLTLILYYIVRSKCLPILLYATEACPQSLKFTITRIFTKICRTDSTEVVKNCQFNFSFFADFAVPAGAALGRGVQGSGTPPQPLPRPLVGSAEIR